MQKKSGEAVMLIYLQMIESEEDKSKFIQIYTKYRSLMFYVARQILGNDSDAEDAVHEAFLASLKHLHKFSDIDCPKTRSYFVTIVESKSIDHIRKRKHEIAVYDDARSGIEIPMPSDHGLADVLASLEPKYRQVILLRYDNGYSAKEIAAMLGKTQVAVEKMLWRAKKELEIQLRECGEL